MTRGEWAAPAKKVAQDTWPPRAEQIQKQKGPRDPDGQANLHNRGGARRSARPIWGV
jgi:hypothetical protein